MGFDVGSLFGSTTLSGLGSDIFGKKPAVIAPHLVDYTEEQKKAIQGNIENFPEISKLGDLYSSEQLREIEKILPGYGEQLTAGRATTDALFSQGLQALEGKVPQDVADYVRRQAAQSAMGGGYYGSPMAGAGTLRDLGLTSLDMISRGAQWSQQGVNSMQAWDALARRDMLAPESMFITPQQQAALTQQNNALWQGYKQNLANVRAAPDPVAKGAFDSAMQVVGMVLSVYGGGSGYKPQQGMNPIGEAQYAGGYVPQATTAGGYGPIFNQGAAFSNQSYLPVTPAPSGGDFYSGDIFSSPENLQSYYNSGGA